MRKNILLIIVLVLAFALRVVDISNNPPAMYGDELTMVLDVNSILHTGYDQTGKFLPLNFSMGGGRPVGYGYLSIPFVAIFGTTELGIRFLSILSGVGLVWGIYYIGKKLFSKKLGLVAAGIMAINPWDISLSRGGFETHLALFLSVLGTIFFLEGNRKKWFYVLSILSFGLAINTYSTYKLTIPIFTILLLWFINFKKEVLKIRNTLPFVVTIFIGVLFFGLLVYGVFFGSAEGRFLSINVFSQTDLQQKLVQNINEDVTASALPHNISKLINNKPLEYGGILIGNYLNHFSGDFLFLHGDGNPRHNMATLGEMYLVEIVTVFFGLFALAKFASKKIGIFLLSWIAVAPLPTMLIGQPHALRSSFMLPPLILISALGFLYIWDNFKRFPLSVMRFFILASFILGFIIFVGKFYFLAPNKFGNFWSVGAKVASQQALENKDKFDYVLLSDRIDNIEFAYPVYAKIPLKVLQQSSNRSQIAQYQFKKFGNVYITHIPNSEVDKFMTDLKGSVMYIGAADEALTNFGTLQGKDNKTLLTIKKLK